MKLCGFSQLPVLLNEHICGLITESIILEKVLPGSKDISILKAKDVMEDAPPIISPKTSFPTLVELLRTFPAIIVSEKGQLKGIICKSDLLGRAE